METLDIINWLSWFMIGSGVVTFIALISGFTAGYGRYSPRNKSGIPASIAWVIQESPSFFIALYYTYHTTTKIGMFLNLMFVAHYFNRTFIFPLRLNSRSRSPWYIVLMAFVFCCWNGYIQGAYNANYQPEIITIQSWLPRSPGVFLFFIGMVINHRADETLMSLRRPGQRGYQIPRGELFEYFSCPNYFGEIVEWIGYAIVSQSLPALAFAIFTFCNIGPRAISHHNYYIAHFPTYPRDRKALIPFVW